MPKRVQRGGEQEMKRDHAAAGGCRKTNRKRHKRKQKTKKKITERIRKKLQRKASKTQQFAL